MRSSAEKLRWLFLSGAVLLACAIAAIFGLANYRAGKVWQRILARNGVNLQQETNGFTYSQSDGKRTVFTLHAAKAVPHGKGKWSLSNAVLVLYSKDGRTDRIYGSQFDYDQGAGVARAAGEVHMDLQAPAATGKGGHGSAAPDLSFTPGDESAADPALIHVRTRGLVYTRKLGVAATQDLAEFRYGAIACTSRGAQFDSKQSVLHLLADVHLNGTMRGAPFALAAAHADLDRSANTAELLRPVLVSEDRNARAEHAVLHLRPGGSLETGEAEGAVELRSGTQLVSAPRMEGAFDAGNRPQHALLSGGVRFMDTDAARPAQGAAKELNLEMTQTGMLRTATADGGVTLLAKAMGPGGQVASRQLRSLRAVGSFEPESRASKRSTLRILHLVGAAEVTADSSDGSGRQASALTRVQADDLTTTFASGGRTPEPKSMSGAGHTQMEQRGPQGQHQLSTGGSLQVQFAERLGTPGKGGGSLEVVSATQAEGVVLRSWSNQERTQVIAPPPNAGNGVQTAHETAGEGGLTVGHAAQAVYEAAAGTLTLTGTGGARADVYDGETQISAPVIVLHGGTGDGEARGGVLATTGGENNAAATHVLADHAALLHRAGLSQFFGTEAQPARLWQEGSEVEAARLVLDARQHGLSARPEAKGGLVHAVLASARTGLSGRSAAPAKSRPAAGEGSRGAQLLGNRSAPEASRDAIDVHAAAMDYNEAAHEATFVGDVRLRGSEGDLTGEHGAAFLTPPTRGPQVPTAAHEASSSSSAISSAGEAGAAGFGGKLQRFVLLGDVRLTQPGRTGAGEQLTYTAATDSFVLTGSDGHPPRVHDAQQGLVTGATLVFGAADSSIVVGGAEGGKQVAGQTSGQKSKPVRVHTETDLKQP